MAKSGTRIAGERNIILYHRIELMVTVRTLLEGVDVVQPSPVEIPINSVTADSRRVWPGSAFVAVEGYCEDGLDYVQDAIDHGAALIISNGGAKVDDILDNLKTPSVRVKNIRKALSGIAANLHGHPSEKLTAVGITGTNGKTTTGYIIDSILKASDIKCGMVGTLGVTAPGIEAHTGLTTPDSLELQRTLALFVDGGLTHSVIEVSSHALELDRVADVAFDMAVFTNFSQDHLDFHKSMDNYFQAKSKLFAMLSSDKCAVLNSDDPKSEELKKVTNTRVVTYAVEADADVKFSDWGMSIDGIRGTVEAGGETIHISSSLIGSYNLHNILAAVAAATVLEIPVDSIESGIQSLEVVPGRIERMMSHNGATVIVDYAHTPDAYNKLFSSLKTLLPRRSRLGVIFGCGGDRDQKKRPLMAAAAEAYADKIYVAPDNPRTESIDTINKDIAKGFKKESHSFHIDRVEAIREAVAWLEPGDILAIVGKGREDYQITGVERIHHSDVKTVKKTVKELAGDEN